MKTTRITLELTNEQIAELAQRASDDFCRLYKMADKARAKGADHKWIKHLEARAAQASNLEDALMGLR